ncbi:MAG: outer membrane protein assembly factor BamE [Verrucomicrobiota bacterium]|nr:outer membrane protein assembly factor BamE [Verrucomicrobiota bacterium]MDQ6940075.1 outer membrane protein assembly factor BamE [Verrucomicrobiota bacterium]
MKIASRFLIVASCALIGLTSCQPSRRLRKANVDQVERGMAKKQVESILGPPTNVETKDLLGMKKTTYLYTQGKDSVTVTFRDDKVESKESTLNH